MRSGTVELSSRRWKWQVTGPGGRTEPSSAGLRESAMGDAEPEPRADDAAGRLELEDPEDPRIRMSRDLPADTDIESEEEARELARDPDVRTVVDDDGDVWSVAPVQRPDPAARNDQDFDRPPLKVRYAREGEPERMGRLPPGRTLGEASREDLLDLVRG